MLLAIAFCIEHRIQFELYNKSKHFVSWNALFLPFCNECSDSVHEKYNRRFIESKKWTVFWRVSLRSVLLAVKHWDRKRFRPLLNPLFESRKVRKIKKECHFDYFTHDLWFDFRSLELGGLLKIEELGFDGTRRELLRDISRMIWRFNANAQDDIDTYMAKVNIRDFVGLHIRRGDKWIEAPLVPLEGYMKHLAPGIKNLFVMSDDYRTVEIIRQNYPNYNVFTLESSTMRGWSVELHYSLTASEWYATLLPFLASIEIMKDASVCLCTLSSGIGLYLDLVCPNKVVNCDI